MLAALLAVPRAAAACLGAFARAMLDPHQRRRILGVLAVALVVVIITLVAAPRAAAAARPASDPRAAPAAHRGFADEQRAAGLVQQPLNAPAPNQAPGNQEVGLPMQPIARPTCVSAAEEVQTSLAAGQYEACAITDAEGRVVCWGDKLEALAVPDDALEDQVSVVMRANLRNVLPPYLTGHNDRRDRVYEYGDRYDGVAACGLSSHGDAACWGRDSDVFAFGNLDGSTVTSVAFAPWQKNLTGEDTSQSAATAAHGVAHTDTWREVVEAETADGEPIHLSTEPVHLSTDGDDATLFTETLSPVCAVVGGGVHCSSRSCGFYHSRISDHRVFGHKSQAHYPPITCSVAPVPADAQVNQVAVVLADALACSLSEDGDVACWSLWQDCGATLRKEFDSSDNSPHGFHIPGRDSYRPPPCDKVLPPQAAAVPPGAQAGQLALSAGYDYVCALGRAEGGVHCWGPRAPHVPRWARTGAAALAAGPSYTCTVSRGAGAVRCWAHDHEAALARAGELPIALSSPVYTPLSVARGQVAVAAGPFHACALDQQGRVACWGLTAGAIVPEMLTAPGAVRLPCVPRAASALPPPTPREVLRCSGAALRAYPGHDAIGTQLGSLRVADEAQCRAACCREAACVGYSLAAQLLPPAGGAGGGGGGGAASSVPCVLLSAVRQLVPSNVMSAGVRPAAVPAA